VSEENPFSRATIEQLRDASTQRATSGAEVSGRLPGVRTSGTEDLLIAGAALVALAVAIYLARFAIRRLWLSRTFRRFVALAATWIFAMMSASFVFEWDRRFDEAQLLGLIFLPPIGVLLAGALWRWANRPNR
jgi:hypothetical protein